MKKQALFLILALFTASTMAQKAMQPADLFKFGRIGGETVSPDGKQIIYTVTNYDLEANKGRRQLYSYDVSAKSTKILVDETYNPSQIAFSPDGKKIGFLSAKSGSDQLWEIPREGGEALQVTKVEDGITLFLYDPSGINLIVGRRIKMDKKANEQYPQFPKSDARVMNGLMYRHWNEWSDYSFNHIFLMPYVAAGEPKLIDLLEGEKYHTPTMPFGGVEELSFSPDGSKVYYTCKKLYGTPSANSTNTDIYEYTIQTGKTQNLSMENKGYDKAPQSSADGKYLAWLSMERAGNESDKNRILLRDTKSGSIKDLTKDFIYSVDGFTWSSDNSKIYFTCAIAATHQIYSLELKSGAITQLTKGDHDYMSVQAFGKGKNETLLAARMSISYPKGLYLVSAAGEEQTQIDDINKAQLAAIKMGKVEKRMIKASDSADILTWVIYPPNFDKNKKYPTLLYCQGGPQSPVSQFFSYRWNFQLMAAQGYIVVAPNRRGLPGFGQEWTDQISHDYGGQAMKDLLSAIDHMAKEPFVNKEKLGAVGASFGGYSVYWLAGNHENRFKAFISHCGMFNMESWYGTTEEMFFANNDNGPYWMEKNKENYKKHSPHQYVDNWNTPILVIHNELDYRVPLSEGMQAFTAAQQKMIPSKFLYFPDEGHWVNKPQNALLWQTVFFEWLDQWLK